MLVLDGKGHFTGWKSTRLVDEDVALLNMEAHDSCASSFSHVCLRMCVRERVGVRTARARIARVARGWNVTGRILPNLVIRPVEKFVRRLPAFIVFLTRPTHLRKCSTVDAAGVDRGSRGGGRNGSMIKLPSHVSLSLLPSSYTVVPSILAFDSFERTACGVTARNCSEITLQLRE